MCHVETASYRYQALLQPGNAEGGKEVRGAYTESTLEEYKEYIDGVIAKIPFHPSHRKITEYLHISDEGYQAMKNDPEYEQWVLDHIRENRSVNMSLMTGNPNYISGTDYVFIGATKEECHGEGYNNWKDDGAEERRAEKEREKKRKIKMQYQKDLLKKQELKKMYEHTALKKEYYSEFLQKKFWDEEMADKGFKKKIYPPKTPRRDACSSYESSFMIEDLATSKIQP